MSNGSFHMKGQKQQIKFLLSLLFVVCHFSLFSQKKFEVTLSFPETLDLSRLIIKVDQGFGRIDVPFKISNSNKIELSEFYYGKYAAIILRYPQNDNMSFGKFFFLEDKPAKITFQSNSLVSSPFEKYSLKNALDFKAEITAMDSFIIKEKADFDEFFEANRSLIFDGKHPDLSARFRELDRNLY